MSEDKSNLDSYPQTIEIPKVFYADLTGSFLEKCVYCETSVLTSNAPYLIEKALKPYGSYDSYATLFEYAVCVGCTDKMKGMISNQSMTKIMDYFLKNMKAAVNGKNRYQEECFNVLDWISNCAINGIHISELSECQIYALCINDQMLFTEFPYMVSGQALDEVVDLLSAETLDELDRFKSEFVDGPSEFKELLDRGPKVFI